MRIALGIAFLLIAGCAGEKLALLPSPAVDLSGQWKLNEADSDDPLRVALSQNVEANAGAAGSGQGGQGGGQGRRGGGRGAPAGGYAGPTGPAMPGVVVLNDGLRWPGKDLTIDQSGGVVTISSMGARQTYRPTTSRPAGRDATDGRDRRDELPPVCGWDGKTLVVSSENPDDDHPPFEERFNLSEDGTRLLETVAFKGGRSRGFTVSRVWDRVPPANPAP